MDDQLATVLVLILMTCTSYLTVEAVLSRRVRARRQDVGLFTLRQGDWLVWVSRDEEPGLYWFWTLFYSAGFLLGAYIFVT